MDFTTLYAKIVGGFLSIVGLGMLINTQKFKTLINELSHNDPIIILTGMLSLMFGLVLVFTHHVLSGWPIIITLIAYFAIIKGIMRICFTQQWVILKNKLLEGKLFYVWAFLSLAIGLFLLFFGLANW